MFDIWRWESAILVPFPFLYNWDLLFLYYCWFHCSRTPIKLWFLLRWECSVNSRKIRQASCVLTFSKIYSILFPLYSHLQGIECLPKLGIEWKDWTGKLCPLLSLYLLHSVPLYLPLQRIESSPELGIEWKRRTDSRLAYSKLWEMHLILAILSDSSKESFVAFIHSYFLVCSSILVCRCSSCFWSVNTSTDWTS